ncbi:MAG: cobalamin-dependent protein [Anaerolineales bacterium]|jgi:radical SAM superfamily enzyme YgiQ (UPF0313 family)
MKVLLVNPFFFSKSALERKFKTFYFPLGLLYLAASAREAGFDVSLFDGTFKPGVSDFAAALERIQPDVVCLASWITVQPTALRLAEMAAGYDIPVVMGGPGPSSNPQDYLDHPAVDALVVGEGERTLIELLEALKFDRRLTSIKGLALREDNGDLLITPERELIHDLDELPFPARDLIKIEDYLDMWEAAHGYRSLTLSMTRGCPDPECPFCAESVVGVGLRIRSIENIVSEMLQLQEQYAIDRFRLVDDLNRLEPEWLSELGKAMLEAGVKIPYEGLNTIVHEGLPMLAQTRDICHERNSWIPTKGKHGHAPPTDDMLVLRRRWEQAVLLENERLEDP